MKALWTAKRVLQQLKHDPRTIALLFIVPLFVISLFKWVFNSPEIFDRIAPLLIGLFPTMMLFMITSIATLRERKSGTMERLMTLPMSRLDFLFGYGIAFALVAVVQASLTSTLVFYIFDINLAGGIGMLILVSILSALLGTSMGLFASSFATTEFQAIQMVMVFLMPQILLGGLFVPRPQMTSLLYHISDVLPISYTFDWLQSITTVSGWQSSYTKDMIVVLGYTIGLLILGASTIKRRQKA